MYILLLAVRYLRSRYIALASIISVMLGVATLIVVNSVMDGFSKEMRRHLHGIMSDVQVVVPGIGQMEETAGVKNRIKEICGDDLEAITEVVQVPALLHFDWRGQKISQQVMLFGIDDETYANVSDFRPYLQNSLMRKKVSFDLKDEGYAERLGEAGWDWRRGRIAAQREYERALRDAYPDQFEQTNTAEPNDGNTFHPLPDSVPELVENGANTDFSKDVSVSNEMPEVFDPRVEVRPIEATFDPMVEQHTGVILGIAIGNRKVKDPETGEIREAFLCRPGDDVQISFPTVGDSMKAVTDICTVVDFYESRMHEYDSGFAFMPLSHLQKSRHMIDRFGQPASSGFQIRIREGADLDEIRDKLIAAFPPTQFGFNIQTWEDTQRPLLAAAQLELTILNILLFLIIAVAGFGILATFFMIVVEKTKDIGILKSLGASSRGVMSIFLGYGLSLGIVGSGVGIVGGLLFVVYINDIAELIGAITGRDVFDPTIYYFDKIPAIINPFTVVWVAVGATFIAVMASVLPAIRAAQLHPVEALRYE